MRCGRLINTIENGLAYVTATAWVLFFVTCFGVAILGTMQCLGLLILSRAFVDTALSIMIFSGTVSFGCSMFLGFLSQKA